MVLFGLLGLYQSTLGPLIPIIRDDNHLTGATAGLLVSGFFAGSLASTVAGGALPERWARTYLVVVPAALLLAGSAGLVVRGPWPLPLLAVVVAGLGFGGLVLVVNTAMASQPGRRGVTLANLVNGVFGLGAAAGPALVGLTRDVGYPYLFGVLAVAILLTLPNRHLGAVRPAEVAARSGRAPGLLPLFGALLFCYAGIETGLSSWETVHLEAHGYPPGTASALTSLFWLGLAASRLLVPLLTTRWPPARLIATTLTGMFGALVLIAVPNLAPAGYLLAGALAGPVFPTALAWHASTHPDPRRGNAVLLAAAMIGNVTAPAALGYTMQATSDLLLPALVAVPVLACLTITLVLRGRAGPGPTAR